MRKRAGCGACGQCSVGSVVAPDGGQRLLQPSDAVDNVRDGLRLTGTHYGTYHARYGERIKEWTGADLAVSLKERVQRPRLDGRHQAQSR